MRKFSMILAAAAMVFAVQAAWAADDADDDAADTRIEQSDDGTFVGRWRSRRGPGAMTRFGHGPQMMPHRGMHPGAVGMGGIGGMNVNTMLKLGLTDDQIKQAVDLMTENYRERLTATVERVRAYEKLADLHESGGSDHDAIIAANQAVGLAQGKLEVLANKLQSGLKNILTPEQQTKMDELKQEWKKRFDERREGREGPDGERRGKIRGGPRTLRGPGPRMMGR